MYCFNKMYKLYLSILFLLALLGYVYPEKESTVPVLYLDRWAMRACNGISLSLGGVDFTGSGVPIYGHTINVPLGYEVLIIKEPLFGVPRETLYHEGTTQFVSYFFWDTPILRIRVFSIKKNEKTNEL